MVATRGAAALAVVFLLAPASARADIMPPPSTVERQLAGQISAAGYACPGVNAFRQMSDARASEYVSQNLVPYDVTCDNGRHYLVANPPRRRFGTPQAEAHPVIKPLQ